MHTARGIGMLCICSMMTLMLTSMSLVRSTLAADQAALLEQVRSGGGKVVTNSVNGASQVRITLDALELTMPKVSEWLPRLREIDNLIGLELVNSELSVTDVAQLAAIKSLRNLSAGFSSEACQHLDKLSQVQSMNLAFSTLTMAGYQQLGSLDGLKSLELRQCNVSNEALRALCNSSSLESLGLMETAITDEGVKALGNLKRLKYLSLEVTRVTSTGIEGLRDLPQLQWLDLYSTQVDDRCMDAIASIKSLQALVLDNTRVTDAGLTAITALPHLQRLNLRGTEVSDLGLKKLERMTELRMLVLDKRGPIHGEACAQLREALPQCKISRL